ncbi:MAG: hypothetical protein JWO11_681 [Nocardioides sp.]|nr:hypothetical protein [Nocardioides sp.]
MTGPGRPIATLMYQRGPRRLLEDMSQASIALAPRHLVVSDPRSGQVVELPAGSCLVLKFRPRGHATTHWRIEDRPGHLVPLGSGRFEFQFLVFGTGPTPAPLRLVRSCDDCCESSDVRDVTVIAS